MPYKNKRVKCNWSEEKKLEVVQAFILMGQLRLAAATVGIPEQTVKVWRATQWWRDTESELRRSSKLQLSAKLTDTVQKALAVVNDRLEKGDFFFNAREGVFIRKPVSAEHANKITTQLIDKTLVLEKAALVEKIDDVGVEARLKKLMQDIAGFARKSKTIEGEIIDVQVDGNTRQDNTENKGLVQVPILVEPIGG